MTHHQQDLPRFVTNLRAAGCQHADKAEALVQALSALYLVPGRMHAAPRLLGSSALCLAEFRLPVQANSYQGSASLAPTYSVEGLLMTASAKNLAAMHKCTALVHLLKQASQLTCMHLPCLQDFLKRIPSTNSLAGQESQLQHLQQHFQRHASSEALVSPAADMGELCFGGVPRVQSLEFLRSLVGSSGAPTSPPLKQEPVTSGASEQGCCRAPLALPASESGAGKDKLLRRSTPENYSLGLLHRLHNHRCVLWNISSKAAACHLLSMQGEAAGSKCKISVLYSKHCVGHTARRCTLLHRLG